VDSRYGKSYTSSKEGEQVWLYGLSDDHFPTNLAYAVAGSECGISPPAGATCSNCYGCDQRNSRMYDWATAMDLAASCNSRSCASYISAKHKGLCPVGWHIPTDKEFEDLVKYRRSTGTAGRPFFNGKVWTASEIDANTVHIRCHWGWSCDIRTDWYTSSKDALLSVTCVKD